MGWSREAFAAIPRLGWLPDGSTTPITAIPALAERLGLASLTIKRDDQVPALLGGSKPRKLDYLLATPPFKTAQGWHATGGIGSGNLVAVATAARAMGRRVTAHTFWEPLSRSVLDNLANIASGPTDIVFYRSRVHLALRRPRLLVAERGGHTPVILPGATTPRAVVGIVRGALELGEQIAAGELPKPHRLYVALGSGGTAVGLSIGLAMAGVDTTVVAVAVIERPLSTAVMMRRLQQATIAWLEKKGVVSPGRLRPLPLQINRRHLGRGYAIPTAEAVAAVHALRDAGLELEPIYTGKAMAALLRDAAAGYSGDTVFWNTAHEPPVPHDLDWRDRLPVALRQRLGAVGTVAI